MPSLEKIKQEIKKGISILENGGILIYPSDTLWALGCDATNDLAVEKLIQLKKRSTNKGLIVLIAYENDLQKYVKEVPSLAYELWEYAENPLTLVLEGGQKLSSHLLGQDGSVAIRLIKSGFCFELLKTFKKPIISTSVNISGENSAKTFMDISQDLLDKVDYSISSDFFQNPNPVASTIIRLKANGTFEFIRK